jgi:hypothetical protein
MPLADKEGDGIVLMVGGKVSNRISTPKFSNSHHLIDDYRFAYTTWRQSTQFKF